MTDYLTKMRPAIDAAAEGRLRCIHCGLPLTLVDPFNDRVLKAKAFGMTVRAGEPVAWCEPPCEAECCY